jgi:hypothetical protein
MSSCGECLLSEYLQEKKHTAPNLEIPYHAELHDLIVNFLQEVLGLSPCHDIVEHLPVLLKTCFTILNKNRDKHPAFEFEIYELEIGELSNSLYKEFFLDNALKTIIGWNLILSERKESTDEMFILTLILTQWDDICTRVGEEYNESLECNIEYEA